SALLDDAFEQRLRIGIDLPRLGTDLVIVENEGEAAAQLPRREERGPVDARDQLSEVVILEHARAEEPRHRRRVARPVAGMAIGAGRRERDSALARLAFQMLLTD